MVYIFTFSPEGPTPKYISPKLPPPMRRVIRYLLFTKLVDINLFFYLLINENSTMGCGGDSILMRGKVFSFFKLRTIVCKLVTREFVAGSGLPGRSKLCRAFKNPKMLWFRVGSFFKLFQVLILHFCPFLIIIFTFFEKKSKFYSRATVYRNHCSQIYSKNLRLLKE
jgi:hypothetical protein